MNFERARSREQKDIRKGQIIEAALSLYSEVPYEKITLAAIAKKLCFTRANLYKYASSKEEIFLWIILRDFKKWSDDLDENFTKSENLTIGEFAHQWTGVLSKHTQLIELFSILYTVLEKNATIETLAHFKGELFQSYAPLFPLINRLLPFLDKGGIESFIHMQLFYAMGLYPGTQLTDVQKRAEELAGVKFSTPQFEEEFIRFITFTLEGLKEQVS